MARQTSIKVQPTKKASELKTWLARKLKGVDNGQVVISDVTFDGGDSPLGDKAVVTFEVKATE